MARRTGLTVVTRNAFSRTDLVRVTIDVLTRSSCAFCGGLGRFRYGEARDDGRIDWGSRGFCGIDCFRSYDT